MDPGSNAKGKKKSKSAAGESSSTAPPVATPNTEGVAPAAVPKAGAGKGAAAENVAAIYNYVPFHSDDLYEALTNLGRTTTVDDCWSIFSGLNSETGSPLDYEEFVRMLRHRR